MGEVSLHGVASATNIEVASWLSARTAKLSFYVEMSPSPPLGPLLASFAMSMNIVRRGERHEQRVRVLGIHQQRHKIVVLRRNITVASNSSTGLLE
ncbi:hypothetical protein PF003_g26483 [Phytophthora fragariae]|nr:hypothetical protein PF003_g26483 [Phytophthora fragariae]